MKLDIIPTNPADKIEKSKNNPLELVIQKIFLQMFY